MAARAERGRSYRIYSRHHLKPLTSFERPGTDVRIERVMYAPERDRRHQSFSSWCQSSAALPPRRATPMSPCRGARPSCKVYVRDPGDRGRDAKRPRRARGATRLRWLGEPAPHQRSAFCSASRSVRRGAAVLGGNAVSPRPGERPGPPSLPGAVHGISRERPSCGGCRVLRRAHARPPNS